MLLKKIGELTALYMDLIEKSINANLDRIEEIEEQLDKVQETVSLIKKVYMKMKTMILK